RPAPLPAETPPTPATARGHGLRAPGSEASGIDVPLPIPPASGPHLGGDLRYPAPEFIAGERGVLDPHPGLVDALELVQQGRGLPLGLEGRRDRGFDRGGLDAVRGEVVERLQALLVEGEVGPYGPAPRAPGAVRREPEEERPEPRVRGGRHVQGRARVEQRAQAVSQDPWLVEGDGQAGGEISGVAPRRTGGDPTAVDHGDLYAVLLQEPGGGKPHHTGTDHDCRTRSGDVHEPVSTLPLLYVLQLSPGRAERVCQSRTSARQGLVREEQPQVIPGAPPGR